MRTRLRSVERDMRGHDEATPSLRRWETYQFDFGDSWEHVITIEDPREGSLDGDPEVVETHGPVPPQYRDPNE